MHGISVKDLDPTAGIEAEDPAMIWTVHGQGFLRVLLFMFLLYRNVLYFLFVFCYVTF